MHRFLAVGLALFLTSILTSSDGYATTIRRIGYILLNRHPESRLSGEPFMLDTERDETKSLFTPPLLLRSSGMVAQGKFVPRYNLALYLGAMVWVEGRLLHATGRTDTALLEVTRIEVLDASGRSAYQERLREIGAVVDMHEYARRLEASLEESRRSCAMLLERWQQTEPRLAALEQRCRDLPEAGFTTTLREAALHPQLTDQLWLAATLRDYLARQRDKEAWFEAILPSVAQFEQENSVGSGTLLDLSEWGVTLAQPPAYALLTAYHVVRDIVGKTISDSESIPLRLPDPQSGELTLKLTGRRIAQDIDLDLTLLRVDSDLALPTVKLLPEAELQHLQVGREVAAFGCPLGIEPIATFGTLSLLHHSFDNRSYCMISAPTFIGNSGGGIFVKQGDNYFIASVYVKIYSYGNNDNLRQIPHLGLGVEPQQLRDWLNRLYRP